MPYTEHQDEPTIKIANNHCEVHTASSGVESATAAFTCPTDELKLLDHEAVGSATVVHERRVTYANKFIGTFRTCAASARVGARPNSLVKMHLVNSYLHPSANSLK